MCLKGYIDTVSSEQGVVSSGLIVRKLICLAILFIFICANLQAQRAVYPAPPPNPAGEPTRLTPDEAVELAFKNNLGLETSRTNIATKRRASSLSWNQFIPEITVMGRYSLDNEKTTTTTTGVSPVPWDSRLAMLDALYPGMAPFDKDKFEVDVPTVGTFYNYVMPYSVTFDNPQWNVSIPIQVSLNLSVAMFENMKRLRLDYEGGLISYEKARAQLERDVRKAYHNMLLLQENIALLRATYENVNRQVQMAQANYNAGLAPELTLLQARVARENMRPIIDQAENGLRLSMAQFAMFLGLEYNTPFELAPVSTSDNFIPVDVAEMITKASNQKPDIRELRQTILMLKSARKTQANALLPFLNISWNIVPFTYVPEFDVMGRTEGGAKWGQTGALTVMMGIRLHSLFPFSADFQGVKNMDDQITTANLGLAQLVHGTEIEVYNIVLSLERTRLTAEVQDQTVRLAEQSFRATEQAYRAGLQDYFQVQNAQQSLHQARVQRLEQQFNYLNGLLDLEYAIGVPFGTLSKENN